MNSSAGRKTFEKSHLKICKSRWIRFSLYKLGERSGIGIIPMDLLTWMNKLVTAIAASFERNTIFQDGKNPRPSLSEF